MTTETTERLTWASPVGVAPPLVIGTLIAAGLLAMLYRERRSLGPTTAPGFAVLRLIVVAVTVWMWLGPSRVWTTTTTRGRGVAVVTDVSASMATIDSPRPAADWRWQLAGRSDSKSGDGSIDPVAAADRATVTATAATGHLKAAAEGLRQWGDADIASGHLRSAAAMIQRTSVLVQQILVVQPRPAAQRIARRLTDPSIAGLGESDLLSVARRLPDAVTTLQWVNQQLAVLADRLAEDLCDPTTAGPAPSRIARVSAALANLDGRIAPPQPTIQFGWAGESIDWGGETAIGGTPIVPTTGGSTDLAATLSGIRDRAADGSIAAVLLFSDVAHTAATSLDAALQPDDRVPVFVVPIGDPNRRRDVSIEAVMAPAVMMKDDQLVIEADVQAFGCRGETLTLRLSRLVADPDQTAGREAEVESRSLPIDSDSAMRRIKFDLRAEELGQQSFRIRVDGVDAEVTVDNNARDVDVTVARDRLRVLVADHYPRWEYRYLTQLFRRDGKIIADELLFAPRKIATGDRAATGTLPVTPEQWAAYDVVILGDLSPEQFPEDSQQSLDQFVRSGGSLVLIAGDDLPSAYVSTGDREQSTLAGMLPVERVASPAAGGSFALRLTPAAARHHALMIGEDLRATELAWQFVNLNSPASWLSPYRRPTAAATTLIAAEPATGSAASGSPGGSSSDAAEAFLCFGPLGGGRVLYFSGPQTYRLRYLRGDRFHHRLWGQLLRWTAAGQLAGGNPLIQIRPRRQRYDEHETAVVAVDLTDPQRTPLSRADVQLIATGDGGGVHRVDAVADPATAGRYVARWTELPPDRYRITAAGPAVSRLLEQSELPPPTESFLVRPFLSRETIDPRCDLATARRIAVATGGQVIPPTAVAEVFGLIDQSPIVSQSFRTDALWVRPRWLLIVVGCLTIEWWVRKRRGLT